jgi:hypothetical protein
MERLMERIRWFIDGIDTSLFSAVWRHMSLPPDRWWPALALLAGLIVVCELTRIALSTEHTTSRIAHVTMCLLTFPIQAITLAVVLVHAAATYPGRGWINLAAVVGLYGLWFVTGQATRLARPASEGADLGFMAVGALITLPTGVIAAVVYHG